MTLGRSCSQKGSLIGRPIAWSQLYVCVDRHHGIARCPLGGVLHLSLGCRGLTGQGEGQACHWVGEAGAAQGPACLPSSPLPLPASCSICFLSEAGVVEGALRLGHKSNFPPRHCHLLGLGTLGVSGGREQLPFSQCLRCAPAGPPRPGILFAAQCDRGSGAGGGGGPAAAGRELSGKGPVLAAGREFDGLLCRPRGFSLIPFCVLACSPLTLSDKLLSRRLPVLVKKRQRSRRTLNPWPLGPGGGGWGERRGGGGGGAFGEGRDALLGRGEGGSSSFLRVP